MRRVEIALRGVPPGLLGLGGRPIRTPRPAYRAPPEAVPPGILEPSKPRTKPKPRVRPGPQAVPRPRSSAGAYYDYRRVRASGKRVVQVLPVRGRSDVVAVFWDAGAGLPYTGPVLVGRRVRVRRMTAEEFVERFYEAARVLRVPHYAFYGSWLVLDRATFLRILGMTGARLEGLPPI